MNPEQDRRRALFYKIYFGITLPVSDTNQEAYHKAEELFKEEEGRKAYANHSSFKSSHSYHRKKKKKRR